MDFGTRRTLRSSRTTCSGRQHGRPSWAPTTRYFQAPWQQPLLQHEPMCTHASSSASSSSSSIGSSSGAVPRKARRSGRQPAGEQQHRGDDAAQQRGASINGGSGARGGAAARDLMEDLEDYDDEEGAFLGPYMDAVVKVFCVHTEPNHSLPWQRKRQYTSNSSGFIVDAAACGGQPGDRWLLTNAHSVDYYTQVKVKRRGDDRKFLARVLSIGVDCDIALLTVDDPEFWEDAPLLRFGALPRLQEDVAVVGYPIGGDTISVTAGVVSRIEVTEYSHGSMDLLGVQIDAAINGGNSGGPVFNTRGACVGIAFQALSGSDVENVGYVIPTPVVRHFLADYVRSGSFTGFPALGVQWQRMESEALRSAYGMTDGQKGVLIRRVNPTSHAASLLQPDDVLLSFDGTAIACDGTVPFRTGERIAFSYLISNKFVGDEAALQVLRNGQLLQLDVKLSKPSHLVAPHLGNRNPSYFLVAGLVFTTATEPYLMSEYGPEYESEAPVKLLERLYHGLPRAPGEEVVVLSQVLADDATLGYEDVYNVQVLRVNGTPVRNLAHLAELVIAADTQFLRFDCEYNEAIVVDRAAAVGRTAAVLEAHGIPQALSPDLAASLGVPWPSLDSNGAEEDGAEAVVEEQEAAAAQR